MTFAEAMAAYQKDGDAAVLETAYHAEQAELSGIAAAWEKDGNSALAALDGANPQERQAALLARNAALTEARALLDAADAQATQMADAVKALRAPARARKADSGVSAVGSYPTDTAEIMAAADGAGRDARFVAMADAVRADAGFQEAVRSNGRGWSVRLDASTVTEPMPQYGVADPQNPRQGFLDKVSIVVETGELVVFYRAAEPGNVPSGGTAAPSAEPAGRARDAEIQERDVRFDRVERTKRSIGVFTVVDRANLRDLPGMMEGISMVLTARMRKALNAAALNGDGTGTNWNGILGDLTNTDQLYLMKNTDKLYQKSVEQVDTIFERGADLSYYFMGAAAKAVYHAGFVNARYPLPDSQIGRNGGIAGVPIDITAGMPAHTGLLLDMSPAVVQVVLGEDIVIEPFEQTRADRNQILIRATVDGNVRFWQPAYAFKTTGLNLPTAFL